MGVIWHKVWFDLWHNKLRTLLVVIQHCGGGVRRRRHLRHG